MKIINLGDSLAATAAENRSRASATWWWTHPAW
jgi:hypothetical protein